MKTFTKTAIATVIALSSSFASAQNIDVDFSKYMVEKHSTDGVVTITDMATGQKYQEVVNADTTFNVVDADGNKVKPSVSITGATDETFDEAVQQANDYNTAKGYKPTLNRPAPSTDPNDVDDSFGQGPVVDVPNFGPAPEIDEGFTHPELDQDEDFNNPSDVDPDFGQGSVLPKPIPQPEVDGGFTNPNEGVLEHDQNQAINANTAGIQQNSNAIAGLNNRVDGLDRRMDDMAKDIDTLNDGVAGAMAMSALPQAFMPEETIIGFGAAHFNGSNAIAVGASHKFNDNWTGNLKASFGGETGVALGVGYSF